jgi:hypothetical protein
MTGEPILPARTADQYLANFTGAKRGPISGQILVHRREPRTNIWPILPARTADQYLARYWFTGHAIYPKSNPPRGWDDCTFGADLRVCGLWMRSRSLAANHAGGPGYILLPT